MISAHIHTDTLINAEYSEEASLYHMSAPLETHNAIFSLFVVNCIKLPHGVGTLI